MSKAEKFILENTNNGINGIVGWYDNGLPVYQYWLTPETARKAVEIAREETYNKIWNWLAKHINDYVAEGNGRDIDLMFDDIKQAMEDE